MLELHQRLAEAEQRAAVAERVAAEEIAAQKAKSALGDTLAQAARAEKAENAALVRQVAELKEELGTLKGKKAATPSTSTPSPKTGKKSGESPGLEQRDSKPPQHDMIDPVPSEKAALAESLNLDGDDAEDLSTEPPVVPASPPPNQRGGHLTMVLAILAAISGWGLVIFSDSDSANQIPPLTDTLLPPTAQVPVEATAKATTEAPAEAIAAKVPQVTETASPPVPDQISPPEVAAAELTPTPTASDIQTRSRQNERIEQSVKAAKRANQQRAVLQRRLEYMRKRLTETEAKLATAEQQMDTARNEAEQAQTALAESNKKNKQLLDANAKTNFRTEAKLMAEIKALRKALDEARNNAAQFGIETE